MKPTLALGRVVVSTVALGAIALRTNFQALADVVDDVYPAWILIAVTVNVIAICGSVLLWKKMMQGRGPSFWFLLRAYLAGMFVNNIGLGTVMGDSLRTVELARKQQTSIQPAAVSVIAERALSLLSLCGLASFGAAFVAEEYPYLAYCVWIIATAVLVGFVAIYRVWAIIGNATLIPRIARASVLEIHAALVTLVETPWRMIQGMGIAFGIQLCTVLATMAVTRSLGANLGPWQALTVVPLIVLLVQLPVSVQGIGVREGSYILLFGLVGLSPEVAISAALISYATTLLVSMPGGVILLQRILRRPNPHRTAGKAGLPQGAQNM